MEHLNYYPPRRQTQWMHMPDDETIFVSKFEHNTTSSKEKGKGDYDESRLNSSSSVKELIKSDYKLFYTPFIKLGNTITVRSRRRDASKIGICSIMVVNSSKVWEEIKPLVLSNSSNTSRNIINFIEAYSLESNHINIVYEYMESNLSNILCTESYALDEHQIASISKEVYDSMVYVFIMC